MKHSFIAEVAKLTLRDQKAEANGGQFLSVGPLQGDFQWLMPAGSAKRALLRPHESHIGFSLLMERRQGGLLIQTAFEHLEDRAQARLSGIHEE